MIFADGVKRAGIFEENVFKESLKRADQLDPYRDLLKEDCLEMLEEIVAAREQSKANLFGPLNKSKAELVQRELNNADLNIDSAPALTAELSERQPSVKLSGYINNAADLISDNASVLN